MAKPTVYSFPDTASLSNALDHFVAHLSSESISKSGRFAIALSGGSLPKLFSAVLRTDKSVDFTKWHVFFADERCVPLDHADSNYFLAKKELFDHVNIPDSQIYTIHPDYVNDPAKAAQNYTDQMKQLFKGAWPTFDLIMLGMGPDGHTCSLFPGHQLLSEESKWTAFLVDSPKPPPCRITLTFPVLNNSKYVAFVSTGQSKQNILQEVLEGVEKKYPVQYVNPSSSNLYWFTDDDAVAKLTKVEKQRYHQL